MAIFTVTTTATQDRALAYFVSKGMAPSADALVQQAATAAIRDLVDRYREQDTQTLGEAYRTADATTRDQIRTLLGLE